MKLQRIISQADDDPVIGVLIKAYPQYPLVNIQKTMENHHFSWEIKHYFYGDFP
jgi:hypothetical protein